MLGNQPPPPSWLIKGHFWNNQPDNYAHSQQDKWLLTVLRFWLQEREEIKISLHRDLPSSLFGEWWNTSWLGGCVSSWVTAEPNWAILPEHWLPHSSIMCVQFWALGNNKPPLWYWNSIYTDDWWLKVVCVAFSFYFWYLIRGSTYFSSHFTWTQFSVPKPTAEAPPEME